MNLLPTYQPFYISIDKESSTDYSSNPLLEPTEQRNATKVENGGQNGIQKGCRNTNKQKFVITENGSCKELHFVKISFVIKNHELLEYYIVIGRNMLFVLFGTLVFVAKELTLIEWI